MNYFDYLRMTGEKDTKENFVKFLVDIMGYPKETAIQESNMCYKGEK